jgi:hypothetical protein
LGGLFIDNAMNEGHIFAGYYKFIQRITAKYDSKGKLIGQRAIFKPLGGCIVCMNVWLAVFSFILVAIKNHLDWWWVFPYIFLASFFLITAKKISE